MLGNDAKYKLNDKETFIYGPNIKEDIEKVREMNFEEKDVFKYLKENSDIVDLYLSSNKYKILLSDNLKVKYIIYNKLNLEGAKGYLVVR